MAMTNDWFSALGEPVPYDRRARAAGEAREMGLELSATEELDYIGGVAEAIQNDRPNEAIKRARELLDVTGAYRLLAALCVDPSEDPTEGGDDRWLYAVDNSGDYETRHEAAGAAAVLNRGRDDHRREPTVWAYRECGCSDPLPAPGSRDVCGRCGSVIA